MEVHPKGAVLIFFKVHCIIMSLYLPLVKSLMTKGFYPYLWWIIEHVMLPLHVCLSCQIDSFIFFSYEELMKTDLLDVFLAVQHRYVFLGSEVTTYIQCQLKRAVLFWNCLPFCGNRLFLSLCILFIYARKQSIQYKSACKI